MVTIKDQLNALERLVHIANTHAFPDEVLKSAMNVAIKYAFKMILKSDSALQSYAPSNDAFECVGRRLFAATPALPLHTCDSKEILDEVIMMCVDHAEAHFLQAKTLPHNEKLNALNHGSGLLANVAKLDLETQPEQNEITQRAVVAGINIVAKHLGNVVFALSANLGSYGQYSPLPDELASSMKAFQTCVQSLGLSADDPPVNFETYTNETYGIAITWADMCNVLQATADAGSEGLTYANLLTEILNRPESPTEPDALSAASENDEMPALTPIQSNPGAAQNPKPKSSVCSVL